MKRRTFLGAALASITSLALSKLPKISAKQVRPSFTFIAPTTGKMKSLPNPTMKIVMFGGPKNISGGYFGKIIEQGSVFDCHIVNSPDENLIGIWPIAAGTYAHGVKIGIHPDGLPIILTHSIAFADCGGGLGAGTDGPSLPNSCG